MSAKIPALIKSRYWLSNFHFAIYTYFTFIKIFLNYLIIILYLAVVEASKPKLDIFLKYAKVELAPPTPSEIPAAIGGFRKLITAFGTGKWRHTPVRVRKIQFFYN